MTDPKIRETERRYLCIVTCGKDGSYGIRNVEAVPHQHRGIKPEHGYYVAKEESGLILSCTIQNNSYIDYGWWFKGNNLGSQGRYRIERRTKTIALIIDKAQRGQDDGQYWCWIAQDDWWANGVMTVYVGGSRITRQVSENEIRTRQVSHPEKPGNLIVGLIRDFGQVQNVSAITACLPLPHAAGDPIPWGIIPAPDRPASRRTLSCSQETRFRTKIANRTKITRKQ